MIVDACRSDVGKGLGLYVARNSNAMCRRGNIVKSRRGKSRESMALFWEQMPVPWEHPWKQGARLQFKYSSEGRQN